MTLRLRFQRVLCSAEHHTEALPPPQRAWPLHMPQLQFCFVAICDCCLNRY